MGNPDQTALFSALDRQHNEMESCDIINMVGRYVEHSARKVRFVSNVTTQRVPCRVLPVRGCAS